MKKRSTLIFGLLAALLAFSMVLAGCDDPNKDNGGGGGGPSIPEGMIGTWTHGSYTLVITADSAKLTGADSNGTGDDTVHTLTSSNKLSQYTLEFFFGEGNQIDWDTDDGRDPEINEVYGFGLNSSIHAVSWNKQGA